MWKQTELGFVQREKLCGCFVQKSERGVSLLKLKKKFLE